MHKLMDDARIRESLANLAKDVLADSAVVAAGPASLALVGIRNRGELIADRLADQLQSRLGHRPPVGALDITMYRDDLIGKHAVIIPRGTDISFSIDDKVVILCDDVLETGRSVRAALDGLVAFGRPRIIRMLTLIDRGRREYPIAADFVGLKAESADGKEKILVRLTPNDDEDAVYLTSREGK